MFIIQSENNKDFWIYENELSNKYLITFMSEQTTPMFYLVLNNKHIIMKKFPCENDRIKFYYKGIYNDIKYSLKILKKVS